MSLAITKETRLTLGQLATRRKVSLKSASRWTREGVCGVVLESLLIGGRRYTSEEAFSRFLVEVNAVRAARRAAPAHCASTDPLQEALDALELLP